MTAPKKWAILVDEKCKLYRLLIILQLPLFILKSMMVFLYEGCWVLGVVVTAVIVDIVLIALDVIG